MEDASLKDSNTAAGQGAQVQEQPDAEQAGLKLFKEVSTQQPLEHHIAEILQRGLQLDQSIECHPCSQEGAQNLR